MDNSALLDLYDRECRMQLHYPDQLLERCDGVVRRIRPAPGVNIVAYCAVSAADLDATIGAQIADLQPRPQPYDWTVCAHDPPLLAARLLAHGFSTDEPTAVMLLDLEAVPAALRAPVTADVRRITDRAGLEDVIAVEEQVWGGSFAWMRERFGRYLDTPGFMQLFVAYVDAQPASAAWVFLHPQSQFASLWGGSTLPQLRCRGLYTALLAQRVQVARDHGYRYLLIEAGPQSQPIVAKHGFTLLTTVQQFGGPAAPAERSAQ